MFDSEAYRNCMKFVRLHDMSVQIIIIIYAKAFHSIQVMCFICTFIIW